ncbi:MAG: hypothetical protein R3E33_06025, partial [Rhodocyclaceae bacterium]
YRLFNFLKSVATGAAKKRNYVETASACQYIQRIIFNNPPHPSTPHRPAKPRQATRAANYTHQI